MCVLGLKYFKLLYNASDVLSDGMEVCQICYDTSE